LEKALTGRSSISSSSAAVSGARIEAPAATLIVAQLAHARKRHRTARWPCGALIAMLVVAVVHLIVATFVFPEPMPRRDVRRKLLALTRDARPQLIIAGDSRAECGLIPGMLAETLDLDPRTAINIAAPACDLPGVLAGYREFAGRFARKPIVIISVSIVEVNDRADEQLIGDETLWSIDAADRFRLASPKRAVASLFLPERELVRRTVVGPLLLRGDAQATVADQGYRGETSRHHYPPELLAREIAKLDLAWYNQPVLDGMRWRLFCDAVRTLRTLGAQVVLLDSPAHPGLVAATAGTPIADADHRFREQLRAFCRVESVPLLHFTAEQLCSDAAGTSDPASSFVSLLHLNRIGAARLSARVSDAVVEMIDVGVLHRPGADHAAFD
jgi:hypothetical protein